MQLFHEKKGDCQLDQKGRKLSKVKILASSLNISFISASSLNISFNCYSVFHLCVCTHVAFVSFQGYILCIVCRLYGVYYAFMQLFFFAMFIQYFHLNVMHFPFQYCHSCALVGLFLDAYTQCIMHWLSVGHASDFH